MRYFRQNKYRNKTCRCHAGHIHDSIFEAEYCDQLALLVKAGEIKGYACQVSYELAVNGSKICDHIVDFQIITKDEKLQVHETKGFATDVWHLKHKLFKALFPDVPYIVITKDYRYAPRSKAGRKKGWGVRPRSPRATFQFLQG